MPDNRIFLLPGEATFARAPTTIGTLLGSCVAVCLYDPVKRYGGMNHYMLPRQTERAGLEPGKYGDCAIPSLIEVAEKAGSNAGDLVASVFGGGRVVGHLSSLQAFGGVDVGTRNIEVAKEWLSRLGIRVVRSEVGGDHGRKIHMQSASNQIRVRPINRLGDNAESDRRQAELRGRKIRVLVIDDSPVVRRLLRLGIAGSDDLEVVGEAEDAFDAREKILALDPDVLCLDIIMPRLNGHAFLQKLMRYKPIPTVIVSTMAKHGSEMRRKVLEAGAVDVVDKDELELYKGLTAVRKALLPKLRHAAKTAVQKRRP